MNTSLEQNLIELKRVGTSKELILMTALNMIAEKRTAAPSIIAGEALDMINNVASTNKTL